MTTTILKKQLNDSNLEIIERNILPINEFQKLTKKLQADVEQAKTVLVHFDHIQGESMYDRDQIFSNLLKAAIFFGLNIEKVDFHRQDI